MAPGPIHSTFPQMGKCFQFSFKLSNRLAQVEIWNKTKKIETSKLEGVCGRPPITAVSLKFLIALPRGNDILNENWIHHSWASQSYGTQWWRCRPCAGAGSHKHAIKYLVHFSFLLLLPLMLHYDVAVQGAGQGRAKLWALQQCQHLLSGSSPPCSTDEAGCCTTWQVSTAGGEASAAQLMLLEEPWPSAEHR